MKQATDTIQIGTRGPGLVDFTHQVTSFVNSQKIDTGLLTLFIKHTSASLTIQENADPDVQIDLKNYFEKIVPYSKTDYIHSSEGADDMPAHIKAALLGPSVTIPIKDGRLHLGTWQGIYLCEHRDRGGSRRLVVTLHGDKKE